MRRLWSGRQARRRGSGDQRRPGAISRRPLPRASAYRSAVRHAVSRRRSSRELRRSRGKVECIRTGAQQQPWAKLVEGSDFGNASLQARRALQLAPDADNILNTAAAIAAERNELSDARDSTSTRATTSRSHPQPTGTSKDGSSSSSACETTRSPRIARQRPSRPTTSWSTRISSRSEGCKALGVTK